jgi:hypothetical protein
VTDLLQQLKDQYSAAGRALENLLWRDLTAMLAEKYPDGVSFTTLGEYDSDYVLGVCLTEVADAAGNNLYDDLDDDPLFDAIQDHLTYLAGLSPGDFEDEHTYDLAAPGYKYVKVVAVFRVNTTFDCTRPDDVASLVPPNNPLGILQFVSAGDGYDGEFDLLGADPTVWEIG